MPPSRSTALPLLPLACCTVLWMVAACANAQPAAFADLIGWWRTDLEYNGQRAEMYLRFAEENGKPSVHLTLPPIHGWDFAIGGATFIDNRVQLAAMPLALTYDRRRGTLTGELPEALAPAQKIPVTFRKASAPSLPKPRAWTGPKPRVAWTFNADGPVWAGLAHDAQNGRVIIATDAGTVVALDAASGRAAWSQKTGGKVRARPVVSAGSVYVNSDDGNLYKLDARTGRETWRALIDSRSAPREPRAAFDRYGSSALVHGGRIYVGSADGNLYALEEPAGRELWRATSKGKVYASPVVYDDAILFGSFDGTLYSAAAADGQLRWHSDTRGPIATAPAIAGDRVIVGNRAFELTGRDARTGTEAWRQYFFFSWVDSEPTVAEGRVYVGSSDTSSVLAFDAASGRRDWISPLGGWCWAQPAVSGDRVYAGVAGGPTPVGPRRGALVALDRKSGEPVWIYDVPAAGDAWGFASSPVAANGGVYAADMSGRVSFFTEP